MQMSESDEPDIKQTLHCLVPGAKSALCPTEQKDEQIKSRGLKAPTVATSVLKH